MEHNAALTNSRFGKWGWSVIVYSFLLYYFWAGLCVDGLNVYTHAFSETYGLDYNTILGYATPAGILAVIAGIIAAIFIFGVITGLRYFHTRDKEVINYAEIQQEIDDLREDYGNRDPAEFLEEPSVRGAADGAAAEFERRRDEAVQRFRSHYTD